MTHATLASYQNASKLVDKPMQPPTIGSAVSRIASASTWDDRVEEIRRVPELFGQAQQQAVYSAVAERLYRSHLSAQFALVQWRPEYQLASLQDVYARAVSVTGGFADVAPERLAAVLQDEPRTLRVFRLIIGYTASEFAIAASEAARRFGLRPVTKARIDSMESGRTTPIEAATACAHAIDLLMNGRMWEAPEGGDLSTKLHKPDTTDGWRSVREFARDGVPYVVLLHQRHYGGPFRTLLDATSGSRGELLEGPVESLLTRIGVPFIRTGAHNQSEIAERFGLTIRPAPDFVIFEGERALRAIIECKQANDGGTARDKAARYRALAAEGRRLGGVPVVAVIDGLGWRRVGDALGPVIRETEGRVFTLETLSEMATIQPFARLAPH